ncbi:MAG: hypothetical protein GC137_10775 [Alphaproteobacteria bacterium]|nr:hypothetical protein [Alphaproteobacteria bacterium]
MIRVFFLLFCLGILSPLPSHAARYTTEGGQSQDKPAQPSKRPPVVNRQNSGVTLPEEKKPVCTNEDLEFISGFDIKVQKNIVTQNEINQTVGEFKEKENADEFREKVSKAYGFNNTEEYKAASLIYERCNREIPKGKLDPHGITFWMSTDNPF